MNDIILCGAYDGAERQLAYYVYIQNESMFRVAFYNIKKSAVWLHAIGEVRNH